MCVKSDNGVIIRTASIKDIDAIVDLWKLLSIEQLSEDPYYKGDMAFEGGHLQFEYALRNNDCAIFVAERKNLVIGFIEVWLYKPDFHFYHDRYAYIMHIYLYEEERTSLRAGVRLYKAAEDWARKKNIPYLVSDVYFHNPKVEQVLISYFKHKVYRKRLVKELN